MTTVPVRIGGELVVRIEDLPPMALEQIKSALTIENEERTKAAAMNRFGFWDLPETVALWRLERRRSGEELLCMPRGFSRALTAGLAGLGATIEWQDGRSKVPAPAGYYRPFLLRDYQFDAVKDMLEAQQGFYKAPAGCVAGDTELRFNRAGKGFKRDIADAYRRFHGLSGVKTWDRSIPTYCRALVDGIYRQHLVEDIVYSGPKPVIEIELQSGKKLTCTREHGVLTDHGWRAAGDLEIGSTVTVNGALALELECEGCGGPLVAPKIRGFPSSYQPKYPHHCASCRGRLVTVSITKQVIKDKDGYLQERAPGHPRANSHGRVFQHILVAEAMLGRPVTRDEHVHHRNERRDDNWPDNLEVVTPAKHHELHRGFLKMDGGRGGRGGQIVFIPKYERVAAITDAGVQETYDMVMQDPHNNFVANGIVVHNSGKTVTSLGLMAWSNQRALVIVDKAGLVEQWRERAATFFQMPMAEGEDGRTYATLTKDGDPEAREVGKIGEDVWEERGLTVCLRQTLHSRAWQLDATGWWKTWGLVFFDEGHHLAAETLAEICRKIVSFNLYAVSATPAKSEAKGQQVHAMVGPIIHETPRQVLYDAKVLMEPHVEVLNGDFFAHFHPDHKAKFDDDSQEWKCLTHGCRKKGKHEHRNNYSSVLKKLVEDDVRNERIARRILAEPGHHHLVPSKQLKHLNAIKRKLEELGWPKEQIWALRGEENAKGLSQQIAQEIQESDQSVLLSTVADEGLDIPPIDRVHIVYPMRDEGATIQLVGRGERIAPGKTDAIAIDYREPSTEVFELQFSERARTYRMQGYTIYGSHHSVDQEQEEPSAAA